MNTRTLLLLALAALAVPCTFASTMNPELRGVVSVLPDVPMVVRGDLVKRNAKGRVEETYRVEMVLDWKADVPTARYTIRDAFGASLQHLAITWPAAGQPEYQFFVGQPLRAATVPPLNEPILDTDLSWVDLSLSFLWWPGGETRGEGRVRGRDCHIIDVPAPADQRQVFDGVRLWVDKKIGIVMRAEGYDENAELKRRMEVKSFKKIRDRWIIKDIDFQTFPGKTKTNLLVRDAEERERFNLPDRDERAWPEEPASPVGEEIDTLPVLDGTAEE